MSCTAACTVQATCRHPGQVTKQCRTWLPRPPSGLGCVRTCITSLVGTMAYPEPRCILRAMSMHCLAHPSCFLLSIKQCMQLSSAAAWRDVLHMHKAGGCMLSQAAMRHQLMGCTLGSLLLLHVAKFCSIVCTRYRVVTCVCYRSSDGGHAAKGGCGV